MNWFVTHFERDISASSIFETKNPRQVYLVRDDGFGQDEMEEFLGQLEAAGFYAGFSNVAEPNSIVSIVIGYVFAQFIDPPLVLGSEAKFDLIVECAAAVDVALKYAVWGLNQGLYNNVPTPDDLVRAFTDNVDANASPTIKIANNIDSVFSALSQTGSRRPQLYFFLDKEHEEGGVWNALFVKSKNPTPVPLAVPEDLEEDLDMDNAPEPDGPGYEPGDAPDGVPRSGPRRTIGTRLEVWRGIARRTKGGLRKRDLMRNSKCKVVSKVASRSASQRYFNPEDNDAGPNEMARWRLAIRENDKRFPHLNSLALRRSRMAIA